MVSEGLNRFTEWLVIRLLARVGARMSDRLYNAMAAKFALTAIETVFLRKRLGRVEVLLVERSKDDALYAGQLHSPGSMLRATDRSGSYFSAFERVDHELCKTWPLRNPRLAGTLFQYTPRGPENAIILVNEWLGDPPPVGNFYDVEHLPAGLLAHHFPVIAIAVAAFHEFKTANQQ